ncbi:hypothetical protein P692DRAFT_201916598 [Suillus brevipes Sb2]|nr:hypothetical protein P692DRAFT_201916598 [Suillus brevipes Sb2]
MTFWQTTTGSIIVTQFRGAIEINPGSTLVPLFGVEPSLVWLPRVNKLDNENHKSVQKLSR